MRDGVGGWEVGVMSRRYAAVLVSKVVSGALSGARSGVVISGAHFRGNVNLGNKL